MVKNQHVLSRLTEISGNNYRVVTLSKLYQTIIGIIIQSLKSIGQL